MTQKTANPLNKYHFMVLSLAWTVTVFFMCRLDIGQIHNQTQELSLHYARAAFQSVVSTRSWNAGHGGVYVPITSETQPNPYLNAPNRDIETTTGLKLTKINPAFMTRQIAEISDARHMAHYHITSRDPIRPANKPDDWEREALNHFTKESPEASQFTIQPNGSTVFRYMAPLWTDRECLQCHAQQGYQEGDQRGGISVSMIADPIIKSRNLQAGQALQNYGIIWGLGMAGIALFYWLLRNEIRRRGDVIEQQLQKALSDLHILSGLIPICSRCKKIRDDKGYWNHLEKYIERHSEAQFTHGLCQDCAQELYGQEKWFQKGQHP